MKMPRIRYLGTLVVLACVTVTCANPFRGGYENRLERWPSGEASRLLPVTGPPQLVTSTNMRADAIRMMENGYLLLGRSKFNGPVVDPRKALDLAKEIGACAVIVQQEYLDTITESVPVSEYIPPHEKTVTIKDDSMWGSGQREITVKVDGEYKTTYVPQTLDYYEQTATYWAKSQPPIFGVLVRGLDPQLRQELETNHGVLIVAVITGSPAFTADMLRGDIIVSVAGERIQGTDHFFDLVIANSGATVPVEVLRNGQPLSFSIAIRRE
jgi:hypothetical protein